MKKYRLDRLGIGDLFLFCLEMKYLKTEKIIININLDTIEFYRKDTPNYLDFCKEIIELFIPEIDVVFEEKHIDNPYFENWSVIDSSIQDKYIIEFFDKIYKKEEKESDYIVLLTKVRDIEYNEYLKIKKRFFNYLNNSNKKIYILGEREVEYGVEYKTLGENKVFSIYQDIMDNVDTEKLIDMSIKKLGITLPNVDNILRDMNIAANSNRILIIGRGGFLCLSLVTGKILSLQENTPLNSKKNNKFFTDSSSFLKECEDL
jgi:hypothetical protein